MTDRPPPTPPPAPGSTLAAVRAWIQENVANGHTVECPECEQLVRPTRLRRAQANAADHWRKRKAKRQSTDTAEETS